MLGGTLESLGIEVSADVARSIDDLVELRRDFHAHPELGFEEERTQREVLNWLDESGIEAKSIAGTGVVGLIEGEEPGKVVMVRADMDALKVSEIGDGTFKSVNEGVMHACGHDGHTAMLLVFARILKERGIKKGSVKLMFQPAEEGIGGAARMISAGILENPKVDASLAFHVWTPFEVGTVCALKGPQAASVDGFRITVKGKGTHAARPDEGVDPIAIAAQIVTSSQMLLTRRISPTDPAVLSFTKIEAGSAFNIIPEDAEVLGTIRTYSNAVRDTIIKGLADMSTSIARSLGGSAKFESLISHVPVVNDAGVAADVQKVAAELVGEERVISSPPLMVGEDIGEVFELVPGALVLLGAGNSKIAANFPHHHPRFAIDERVLPIGVEVGLRAVAQMLKV